MIRRIRSSVYLALAFKAYRNDDIDNSYLYTEKSILLSSKASATALAFRATLKLLKKEMSSAKVDFECAAKNILGNGPDANYVELYCQYYLCLIGDKADCDQLRIAALAIPASKSLKEWLSLPDQLGPI